MKKIFIVAIMLLGITFSAQAQKKTTSKASKASKAKESSSTITSGSTIGLRFGSNDGFGTEISYQRPLSKNNRLELDLGFSSYNIGSDGFNGAYSNGISLTGIYQWVWDIPT